MGSLTLDSVFSINDLFITVAKDVFQGRIFRSHLRSNMWLFQNLIDLQRQNPRELILTRTPKESD